jgi:hypothetical protein
MEWMRDEFVPLDLADRTLRYWKLVILMILVGGLTAWLLFQSQPPLFESQATIGFSFNVVRTGKMSESEEDHAMGAAGLLMISPPVPEQVQAAAQQAGIYLDPAPYNKSVFIERRSYRWVVRVRHTDAQAASFLANTWIQAAHAQLIEASGHAERAETLRLFQDDLLACLERSAANDPASAICPITSLAGLQQEIQASGEAMLAEKNAGRGLLPYLQISSPSLSTPSAQPGQFGQAGLILAGMLAGFLMAALAISADLPRRLAQIRNRRAAPGAEPRS